MIYILSFIAYVLIVSWLGWWFNRPKPLTWVLSAKAISVKTVSLSDLTERHRILHNPMIVFDDEESAKRFASLNNPNGKNSNFEKAFKRGVQCGNSGLFGSVDVQKDGLVDMTFNGHKFFIKNESSGSFDDAKRKKEFRSQILGNPWKPSKKGKKC